MDGSPYPHLSHPNGIYIQLGLIGYIFSWAFIASVCSKEQFPWVIVYWVIMIGSSLAATDDIDDSGSMVLANVISVGWW